MLCSAFLLPCYQLPVPTQPLAFKSLKRCPCPYCPRSHRLMIQINHVSILAATSLIYKKIKQSFEKHLKDKNIANAHKFPAQRAPNDKTQPMVPTILLQSHQHFLSPSTIICSIFSLFVLQASIQDHLYILSHFV